MASSLLNTEEENYIRLFMLVLTPGTKAVRVLFDKEFPPAHLGTQLSGPLKSKLAVLKSRKVINTLQWDILFPTTGKYIVARHT